MYFTCSNSETFFIFLSDLFIHIIVMNVSFTETFINEKEGVGVVLFTLTKTMGAVGPVSVHLFTVEDSALGVS